jgi:hypothetical protein
MPVRLRCFCLLDALGLQLAVGADPVATERIKSRLKQRPPRFGRMHAALHGRGKHFYFTPDLLRINGRNGGLARKRTLSERRRKQIARKAALARWGKVNGSAPPVV